MKKFKKINTISIKMKGGLKTIHINDTKVSSYDNNGASFFASEIAAIPVNHLGYFRPIRVEFDEAYRISTGLNSLDHIVVAISVLDDNLIEVFVSVMDPGDITDMKAHEDFQMAMEKVVTNDKRFELNRPVKNPYSKAQKKRLEKQKAESEKAGGIKINFSDVGFVQFTGNRKANTFDDAFIALGKTISSLEKKARKLLKKNRN